LRSLGDYSLLIITDRYPHSGDYISSSFVKDQTDQLNNYFKNVYVISQTPYVPKLFSYLPFVHPRWKRDSFAQDYKCENVQVFFARYFTVPTTFARKHKGDGAFKATKELIKRRSLKFDLIHAHFTWPSGYAGACLKERYDVPFVVTAHGYDIYSLPFKNGGWRERVRFVLNTADHVITVSQSNLACIRNLCVSTPVTVIPNGFKSDVFYPRDSSECRKILNLPQDKKIILTVGNLEPVKGQLYLIEAVQRIVQTRNDVLCVIIGAGKLRTSLERQIRSLGLKNSVWLAGGKPHDEIPLWMNACDLFVLSSLNEGNPTVMFEALGCGKPFVGTRVGGVPEIITSNEYGLLVEPADSGDLAEKILTALDQEWNQEAILRYAEWFTWENIAQKIIEVYNKVCDDILNFRG